MKNTKRDFSLKAWVDLGGQRQFFADYGHVAYQIKGNDACINMVANILPIDPRARLWSRLLSYGWMSFVC